ncbi:hypothetical protein PILCRDRAFT_244381 [Piloderma croceum F 1598]|uniref:Nucleoplasmin-like domain-containing protein n=1 Tax=Piloderma croceum (strain F 1598) TaxID=765440 RepID=A0A0C3FXA4_PILCF|nr:hypothetical protein PILCRDRAFT_244381 [Piloderma croceum F 1598]
MAGNHTGPRTLRLSSDNSPGVLVFTLSQVVANELLSSESINLIISRDEDFPIVSINGVATSGVYEGTDTQIKLEEFMKTEEGFKTELEDTGVWDDKEDVSKIDHTSDDEEAIHDRLSSLDSDDNDGAS